MALDKQVGRGSSVTVALKLLVPGTYRVARRLDQQASNGWCGQLHDQTMIAHFNRALRRCSRNPFRGPNGEPTAQGQLSVGHDVRSRDGFRDASSYSHRYWDHGGRRYR